jgi:hypothetical protein
MAVDASVDAGWYRDPSGRYHERWWDGTSWTGHVRGRRADPEADTIEIATVPPTPAPVAAAGRAPAFWSRWSAPVLLCVYGGAIGIAVGAVLPWVEVSGDVVDSTKTGIDGDGVITLALAVLVALVFTVVRNRRVAIMVVLGIGAAAALVAAYDLFDVTHATGDLPPGLDASASPGLGLLLTGIAAVAITVGAALGLGELDDGHGARRRSRGGAASERVHARRRRGPAPNADLHRDAARPRRHRVDGARPGRPRARPAPAEHRSAGPHP